MFTIGIDIGSTMSKTIVLNSEDKIVYDLMLPTGWSSLETSTIIKDNLFKNGFLEKKHSVIATGYGRISVPYSHKSITEITCHSRGVSYLYGKDTTIIDIGGQDTKIISLKNGLVSNFIMNDKCSAGTGKFLEVMANSLGVSLGELFELARLGKEVTISSMCTVFAESEVIGLKSQGVSREDISFGIVNSVVEKVSQLGSKLTGDSYFLTGGLYRYDYLISTLSKALGKEVYVHPKSQYAGAIGAALLGKNIY